MRDNKKKTIQIAIDGPVGAGKSTVAKRLAEILGITYIYSGAMYRAVALHAKKLEIEWTDKAKVEEVVVKIEMDFRRPTKSDSEVVKVFLFGKEVTDEVFSSEVAEGASIVSQYAKVRMVLVEMQRELAQGKSVVMDGRDIGTNVLPRADLKIYLDADVDERIRRKQDQLKISQSKSRKDVLTRDKREMGRDNDPLRPAKDAWILDTTDMGINQVVEVVVQRVVDMGFESPKKS